MFVESKRQTLNKNTPGLTSFQQFSLLGCETSNVLHVQSVFERWSIKNQIGQSEISQHLTCTLVFSLWGTFSNGGRDLIQPTIPQRNWKLTWLSCYLSSLG